jgi:hypothetical protein
MDIELLTLFMVVIGPLVLAAALAYGIVWYRRRGPATKQLTDDATRDLYRRGADEERRQESPPLSPADAGRKSWKQTAKEKLRP